MKKKWSKNKQRFVAFLMGTTVVIITICSFEYYLIAQGQRPAYQVSNIGGWVMMPNENNRRMRSHQGHDFQITTNKDGLRTSISPQKSNAFRIAVLGDSTVFGWGVNDMETFSYQLQKALSEHIPSVEVLNAAQPGHWQRANKPFNRTQQFIDKLREIQYYHY